MIHRRFRTVALLLLLGGAVAAAPEPGQQPEAQQPVASDVNERFLDPDLDVETWTERFETESREIYVVREAIVATLGLRSGMAVADIGAGTGLFLEPFARSVGLEGRVYAVEISPRFLEHLRDRAEREGLSRAQVVTGSERSPELPAGAVDVAFVCDTYHHFAYPQSMLANLYRALRPGGALVVIDFERIPGVTRDWVLGHVRADKQTFRTEIESAGFVFEKEAEIEGLVENYLLIFRRPEQAPVAPAGTP